MIRQYRIVSAELPHIFGRLYYKRVETRTDSRQLLVIIGSNSKLHKMVSMFNQYSSVLFTCFKIVETILHSSFVCIKYYGDMCNLSL